MKTDVAGGKGTITVTPRDQYGNNVGPGRGDGLTVTGTPGTTLTGPVRDNGDAAYTAPVSWDESSGNTPGVVVGQPGRPPVVVRDPRATEGGGTNWKVLFWILLIVTLLLLVLLIVK